MISKNVAKYRKEAGMSIIDLAEAVNVTKQMISLIEQGRKVPGLLLAKDIAEALGCTIDDLIREE